MMLSKEYWNNRYAQGGNSGYGSYGAQLVRKMQWLDGLDITSISEIGCGDFNFGKHILELYPRATYTGYDISDVIINTNKKLYPQYTFTDNPNVPPADLLLCVDVLLHILDEEELERVLKRLDGYTKYLAVTAYERDENMDTHVRIRKFDYKRYGEPIIREIIEEDGQMYFYVFKK